MRKNMYSFTEKLFNIYLGGVILVLVGWIIHIVNVVNSVSAEQSLSEITLLDIINIVSIFFVPIGSVLGYISLF